MVRTVKLSPLGSWFLLRSSLFAALAVLSAHGFAACASVAEDQAAPEVKSLRHVGAWVTYWDLARGLDRVAATPGALDDAFLFLADLGPDGRPSLVAPENAASGAVRDLRTAGVRTWLTIVNDRRGEQGRAALKDADLVHGLLADPARRAAHALALVALANGSGAAGLDVDYENLRPDDRDNYSAFVRELADETHRRGLQLSVTVQPKTQESRSVGPGAADWKALCDSSDRLQIMLYNLHNSRTGPGPLATKAWISSVLAYATSQCDRARVVPVLKLGAMEWGPDGHKELQYADLVERLAATRPEALQRDPDGGASFFRYEAADGTHTVYFEDAASVLEKIAWIEQLGFEAVVLWSLGREDPQLLPGLLGRKGYQTRISSPAPIPQPE